MIYVKEGHKKDMYFVCQDTGVTVDGYQIVKVFYSRSKADEYIAENQKIGER